MVDIDLDGSPIQNAYVLDWWLILGRKLTNHKRDRGAITLPKRVAEVASLTEYVRLEETEGDEDEQYQIQPSSEFYGVSTNSMGRNQTSIQIPFPDAMLSRVPFEIGDTIALEMDMQTPENGFVLREFDEFDVEHAHSLPSPVLSSELNKWTE